MKPLNLLAATLALGMAAAAPAQAACDRTCLNNVANSYLTALAARSPRSMPQAANVRFTENGQTLKLGDALWATAQGLGDYRMIVPDPAKEEVGLFAVVQEAGQPALLAARLKAHDGKISEIETVVSRKDPGGMGKPENAHVRPAFVTPLAPGHAVPRAQMIAAANSYFEGLAHATDRLTPFDPSCMRIENGVQTTGTSTMGKGIPEMGCKDQFATGFSKFITDFRERRYLVDEKTGVVMAMLFFDHAGTVPEVRLADGSIMKVPPPFNRPFTFQIFELFKIDSGRIHEVEAILNTVPYGMPSGWAAD